MPCSIFQLWIPIRLDNFLWSQLSGHLTKPKTQGGILKRIKDCTNSLWCIVITWKRLQSYWKATNASKKWQLLVYDAIIKSKLLYGLETAQLGKAELKRIDAFQIRGVRQILGKKHTYWDRTATNAHLFDLASRYLTSTTQKGS